MADSCTNNRTSTAPPFIKHKISFSVDSLLSSCTNTNNKSNSPNTSPKHTITHAETRQYPVESASIEYNNKHFSRSDQNTPTRSPSDTNCEDESNEDLEDEELEVDDDESVKCSNKKQSEQDFIYGSRGILDSSQLQYFHCRQDESRTNDDSNSARRSPTGTTSPSTSPPTIRDDCSVTDNEEVNTSPFVPKPLPHPGVTLGAGGPPCWNFPPGLATQFAWMPVYRPTSPT
ncbi:hypothetical protein L9F63_001093, partial [Diploptera punctata]